MSIQTVTTIVSNPDLSQQQLDAALGFARTHDAHLQIVVMALGYDQLGVVQGGLEAMPLDSGLEDAEKAARSMAGAAKARLAHEDVRWDIDTLATVPANINHQVTRHTRFSDLVVQVRPSDKSAQSQATRIAEAVLFDADCPLMMLPPGQAAPQPDAPVMVAWDGSGASLRAARMALPVLQAAQTVHIAVVDPSGDGAEADDPGGAFALFLSRHGVNCEISVMTRGPGSVADTLCQRARETGCELIVMGAYGHSRLRQMLFGGTTRQMLSSADMPILLAH